jgi:hypothetical protein
MLRLHFRRRANCGTGILPVLFGEHMGGTPMPQENGDGTIPVSFALFSAMRKKAFPKTESSSSWPFPIDSRNPYNSFIRSPLHKAASDSEISARSLL